MEIERYKARLSLIEAITVEYGEVDPELLKLLKGE